MTENPPIMEDVQTVDDSGTAVKKRIINASSAYTIFKRMRDSDEDRSKERAKIKGMIDGQRPYSESELRSKGMSWRANVNWRELEGLIDSVTNSYTELLMELAEFIDVSFKPSAPVKDIDGELSQIVAEEYTDLMRNWRKFIPNYMIMAGQLHRYGKGMYFWADPYNWQYTSVKVGNIFVPEMSGVCIDDLDMFMVYHHLSAVRAYEIASNEKASVLGWNVKALRKMLVELYKKPDTTLTEEQMAGEWESMQLEFSEKNKGLDDPAFKPTPIAYVFERAVGNRKSVRMSIIRTDKDAGEYLFDKEDIYKSFNECASLFVSNYGEGDYHDIRGLGKKSFAQVDASNRLMNSILDGAFAMNSVWLSGGGDALNDALRIHRLGPITVIPESLQMQQMNLNTRLDGMVHVRSMLHQQLNNNTGVNKLQQETGGVARVAADVRYRQQKEQSFTANERMIFYSQWDWYHQEVMRRLLNPDYPDTWDGKEEAEAFIECCVSRGVPREALKYEHLKVRARQNLGVGSSLDKETATQEMVKLAASMPEQGAYNALRDRSAVLVGHTNVDRYFPSKRQQTVTNDHSIAQLENNDLMEGSQAVVASDQMHTVHLEMHLSKLIEVGDIFQQNPEQADVQTFARYFISAVDHCAKHLVIMQNNPIFETEAKTYEQTLQAMADIRDLIVKEAEKLTRQAQEQGAADQQAAQQEMDPELRMKLERHALDQQIKYQTARNNMILKQQMQESTIRMREIKEAHRMMLQNRNG